ncbi:Ctr copper transporter family-domain-containing protein [Podospora conica]|nr:Ctr copper transporter family-domain-containing protein [Schizothecium conicum]
MDHGSMDHGAMATGTMTGATAAATSSAAPAMGGMGGMGHGCKISMLWNWNTVDSCFIASSWKITSTGMFAGSCIGVVLLVMSLEFLRRAVKEYDAFLVRRHAAAAAVRDSTTGKDGSDIVVASACAPVGYRPKIWEQAIRALLHMVQFAVAYFIMLLAMYYNGYIIICIFIGAFLGAFVFQWETLGLGEGKTSATKEPTVCCG